MRAAVLQQPNGPIVVRDLQSRHLKPREVRLRLEASGVCHTDLTTSRLPTHAPAIMGHEGAGTIIEVGEDVTQARVGQRVIASYVPSCGLCFHCVRGESTQCLVAREMIGTPRATFNGVEVIAKGGLGTWAEEMIVSELQVVPVETSLPSEQLALVGCGVTTGAGAALWSAAVGPGSTVAVYGCGGVGFFTVQGARIAGAAQIIVVDPLESKREAALRVGATDAVDPAAGDPVEQIRDLTDGRGTDFAFEVVGRPDTMMQAFASIRARGTAVIVGMPAPDAAITLPVGTFFYTEKRLMGSYCGSSRAIKDMPTLVKYAEQGRLDIGAAVSRQITLDQTGEALAALERGEVFRSVIKPD
jgi:S-(hydroxymethyl)glutathione dehydrogenase/alcohol dehydrogenase